MHEDYEMGIYGTVDHRSNDPEYVEYKCLDRCEAGKVMDSSIALLADKLAPPVARLLLYLHGWNVDEVKVCSTTHQMPRLTPSSRLCTPPKEINSWWRTT